MPAERAIVSVSQSHGTTADRLRLTSSATSTSNIGVSLDCAVLVYIGDSVYGRLGAPGASMHFKGRRVLTEAELASFDCPFPPEPEWEEELRAECE